ncbi:DEAD/DEAH box helicase [soil metagenome]
MSSATPFLRAWQREALELYLLHQPRDFLTVATPGAGKTTFALTVAADLLHRGVVQRIVVVTPTDHLKTQWAQAAGRLGINLDPLVAGRGALSADFQGFAITYAGLAANPTAHRVRIERFRTFVILDEVHHAADALSWGDAVLEACEPATRRLALTGTPFRSDDNPIPFVTYEPGADGVSRSVADYSYGYGPALKDGVVRPVLFMAYSGEMRWRTRAGDEVAARLGEPLTNDATAQALRTALDPGGAWIPAVLTAADRRLDEVRRDIPDAGGLVIASDQTSARAYLAVLEQISGEKAALVLSDESEASSRISAFASGTSKWMVAVRMVSEGVDIPRLAVGVYATTTSTPLFFAQAVGRFVRARRRGEMASVFLPSVPRLLAHASDLEVERDHVLGRPVKDEGDLFAAEAELLQRANEGEAASDLLGDFEALGSDASFDRVLYDGGEFGHEGIVAAGSEEELDFIGIPGLLEPDQVADLLRHQRTKRARNKPAAAKPEKSAYERQTELRRELNGLVGAWHHRTGQPHGVTHSQLRNACGGPAAAQATSDDLTKRIDTLRAWALRSSAN